MTSLRFLAVVTAFSEQMPKTAVEMPVPWKSQNDFHRTLEISHRTRDSHISTADSVLEGENPKGQRRNAQVKMRADDRTTGHGADG